MNLTRHPRQRPAIAFCAAIAALTLVACGGDDEATDLPPLEASGTVLKADEYQTTKFKPQTTFEVGSGWQTASTEVPDYFDIVRTAGPFQALAFQRVTRVAKPRRESVGERAPRDLVSWIRRHPKLAAGKPKKTMVAGESATQIDARVRRVAARRQRPTSCETPCLPLFGASDGRPVSYERGDRLRFLVVKAPGGEQVTITIAAARASFASFVPQAEKVLKTLEFEKG